MSLPDARLHLVPGKGCVKGPYGNMRRIFCINCGSDGGAVTEEWVDYVVYLCEVCALQYGGLAAAVEVDEDLVRGAREPDAVERTLFGQLGTPPETGNDCSG